MFSDHNTGTSAADYIVSSPKPITFLRQARGNRPAQHRSSLYLHTNIAATCAHPNILLLCPSFTRALIALVVPLVVQGDIESRLT